MGLSLCYNWDWSNRCEPASIARGQIVWQVANWIVGH